MADWFPVRHDEKVRVAQSVATVTQAPGNLVANVIAMGLGAVMQMAQGFGWGAFVWQLAMGWLLYVQAASWLRLRDRPPPERVSLRRIRGITIFAGMSGVLWAAGAAAWGFALGPEFAVFVCSLMIFGTAFALAASYCTPWAVVAFTMPIIAAYCAVLVRALPVSTLPLAMLFMAAHCVGTYWFLRINWLRFLRSVDMDLERAQLARMMHEQKEIAEKAVQLKSRFLASASHDLRQPMHAISLYLGGLSEIELPPRARQAVADARECAQDMNEMFRSLLDISQLDAQQAVPALQVFPLGAMLAKVEKEFAPLAQSHGVRLRVLARDVHAYSDASMVERIVRNFVSNAIRHAPGGRVLIACRAHGARVRVAVHDNGIGIPESQQQAIFDEFHRLNTGRPADHSGGLGLGLAIVRRLAETLRIPIMVRSQPDRGSMFAVDLPLARVSASDAAMLADAQEASMPELTGKLVVVVDDEVSILQAAAFILEKAGCFVVSARSCREAMAALAASSRTPDAIVCDYDLKDATTGAQTIQAIREEFNADIPAVLVTGATGIAGIEAAARLIRVPVLHKPLDAAALKRSLGPLVSASLTSGDR